MPESRVHSPASLAREWGDDVPMTLAQAVEQCFPLGGVTVSTLRTEARKGRLVTERIAGKDFVTRRAIDEMRARCREQGSRPVSKSAPKQTDERSGSSETDNGIDAQAALRLRLSKPSRLSANTSRTASGRTRANVVRLPSNSEPS